MTQTTDQDLIEAFLNQHLSYQATCVSESWLSQEKIEMAQVSGYEIPASYCRKSHKGGGVCTMLRENIHFEQRHINCFRTGGIEVPKESILLIKIYWNRREEYLFYNQLQIILNYTYK